MVDEVTIRKDGGAPEPSIEEQARAAGIDPSTVDSTAQSQTADTRPEWLPEKFKTPADMAKAYEQLESKLGQRDSSDDDADPDDQTLPSELDDNGDQSNDADDNADDNSDADDDQTNDEYDKVKEDLDKKNIDYKDMSQRFWNNGAELVDEDYEQLDQAGYPKELVDQFIEGQKALVETQRQAVFAVAGDEQEYSRMQQWASDAFSDDEVNDFNEAVNSNRMTKVLSAVRDLKARYEDANGREPSVQVSGEVSKQSQSVYNSVAEMQKDMADDRYKNDPHFRSRVEQKLARSDIMG